VKFGRALLALAAVLTVAAFSATAQAQQIGGNVQGRWDRISPLDITAQAKMFSMRGDAMYYVDMRLHGLNQGHVDGTVTALPKGARPQYQITGTYHSAPGGHYVVNAKIALILAPTELVGPQVPHVIGELNCLLDPHPRVFVIDPQTLVGGVPPATPWYPTTFGHAHGRWWMKMMMN
jgi:hypothetical protein